MEYNIRVYKPELKQEEGKINNLKGFATITFDEAFCVKSLAIKESSKGNLYLDMPRYRDYETGEYVPFFRFTDKEFQKEVLDTVREAYENRNNYMNTRNNYIKNNEKGKNGKMER